MYEFENSPISKIGTPGPSGTMLLLYLSEPSWAARTTAHSWDDDAIQKPEIPKQLARQIEIQGQLRRISTITKKSC